MSLFYINAERNRHMDFQTLFANIRANANVRISFFQHMRTIIQDIVCTCLSCVFFSLFVFCYSMFSGSISSPSLRRGLPDAPAHAGPTSRKPTRLRGLPACHPGCPTYVRTSPSVPHCKLLFPHPDCTRMLCFKQVYRVPTRL